MTNARSIPACPTCGVEPCECHKRAAERRSSNELVRRLRYAVDVYERYDEELFGQAADEIERLQRELALSQSSAKQMKDAWDAACNSSAHEPCAVQGDSDILGDLDYMIRAYPQLGRGLERAKKEIERLRAAPPPKAAHCYHEDCHAAWRCTNCGEFRGECPPVHRPAQPPEPVRLTRRQAAILSAFTGYLCGPFEDMHAYVDSLPGFDGIMTAGLALHADRIREAARADFETITAEKSQPAPTKGAE